jgi:hypothetical protein
VPHRRGSFHEDWNDLLTRFAHKGTPAALEDQLHEANRIEQHREDELPVFDPHRLLFELSQHAERVWNRVGEDAD